jgi:hypothetical protein
MPYGKVCTALETFLMPTQTVYIFIANCYGRLNRKKKKLVNAMGIAIIMQV